MKICKLEQNMDHGKMWTRKENVDQLEKPLNKILMRKGRLPLTYSYLHQYHLRVSEVFVLREKTVKIKIKGPQIIRQTTNKTIEIQYRIFHISIVRKIQELRKSYSYNNFFNPISLSPNPKYQEMCILCGSNMLRTFWKKLFA